MIFGLSTWIVHICPKNDKHEGCDARGEEDLWIQWIWSFSFWLHTGLRPIKSSHVEAESQNKDLKIWCGLIHHFSLVGKLLPPLLVSSRLLLALPLRLSNGDPIQDCWQTMRGQWGKKSLPTLHRSVVVSIEPSSLCPQSKASRAFLSPPTSSTGALLC